MSAPERRDITDRLRIRSEARPMAAPTKPAEIKRMKTSIFVDPDVMEAVDAAFDTYNYENRAARVKKAVFLEQVLAVGMAHAEELAEACREIGKRSGRGR
jgi:hypothetical protein